MGGFSFSVLFLVIGFYSFMEKVSVLFIITAWIRLQVFYKYPGRSKEMLSKMWIIRRNI